MSHNEEKVLTGDDALEFEQADSDVSADVEDVRLSVLYSDKVSTKNTWTDVGVVAAARLEKGTLQVKNLPSAEVAGTGQTANAVQTQILGSNDNGKTFEFTVVAVEAGVSPANSLATGSSRLLELLHPHVANVPDVLTHYKVQARSHVGGAHGTVIMKGAFSLVSGGSR